MSLVKVKITSPTIKREANGSYQRDLLWLCFQGNQFSLGQTVPLGTFNLSVCTLPYFYYECYELHSINFQGPLLK